MGFIQTVSFGEEDCPMMMQKIQNSYPSDKKYFENREIGQPEKLAATNCYVHQLTTHC